MRAISPMSVLCSSGYLFFSYFWLLHSQCVLGADERRTGTVEFLITLPATSWDLTLGKFLACFILLCVALLLTLPLPVFVSFVGNLDWGPVLAGYAAAILLGSSYLSIGLFISAKTENQIVALILTTFCLWSFLLFRQFVPYGTIQQYGRGYLALIWVRVTF